MARVRRSEFAFIRLEDHHSLDVKAFLSGRIELGPDVVAYGASVLEGREHLLSEADLRVLLLTPSSRWLAETTLLRRAGVGRSVVKDLAAKGLVLRSGKTRAHRELLRREERLKETKWEPYAALYHFMTKWQKQTTPRPWPTTRAKLEQADLENELVIEDFVRTYGRPPSHFHERKDSKKKIDLPVVTRDGRLYELLEARRTSRNFNARRALSAEDLNTVLYYVFGCHGYARAFGKKLVWLKKTSPSGGALHPTEVYPLILNVKGFESGLYHYRVDRHSLEQLRAVEKRSLRKLADRLVAGQSYATKAAVLFLMTSRFDRHFWKYQRHAKAYRVLQMDAAHLSQTLYLVCADLGLGAFFTAAINAEDVEETLALDGLCEGAVAIAGCGHVLPGQKLLELNHRPYTPRKTKI